MAECGLRGFAAGGAGRRCLEEENQEGYGCRGSGGELLLHTVYTIIRAAVSAVKKNLNGGIRYFPRKRLTLSKIDYNLHKIHRH
jgi:hypothetical protein